MLKWGSWLANRNVLLAIAAAAIGSCAFLFAHRYLRAQELVVRRQLVGHYATRDILVAARDLPAGTALEPPMLARRAVPGRFLASDALGAEAASATLGRRLARPLQGGEAVTASTLDAVTDVALSALVEPGLRALTIPVDESSAAAGLLSPGDFVDLLLVTHGDDAAPGTTAVRPLLQGVRVVATGQQLRRRRYSAAADQGEEGAHAPEASYATVTLHVSAEDAERILLAQRLGELAVLLRPEGDMAPAAMRFMDAATLLDRPTRRRGSPAASRVQFIIGGLGVVAHGRRSSP